MKTEKKKRLLEYIPRAPDLDVNVKQYETEYLMPYLNSMANDYREHTDTELTTTIFRVLNPDDETVPRQNQYKVTMVNTPGHPLDRMSELFMPSDNIDLLAFDTHTQVKQLIGNIVFSWGSTSSVSFMIPIITTVIGSLLCLAGHLIVCHQMQDTLVKKRSTVWIVVSSLIPPQRD